MTTAWIFFTAKNNIDFSNKLHQLLIIKDPLILSGAKVQALESLHEMNSRMSSNVIACKLEKSNKTCRVAELNVVNIGNVSLVLHEFGLVCAKKALESERIIYGELGSEYYDAIQAKQDWLNKSISSDDLTIARCNISRVINDGIVDFSTHYAIYCVTSEDPIIASVDVARYAINSEVKNVSEQRNMPLYDKDIITMIENEYNKIFEDILSDSLQRSNR